MEPGERYDAEFDLLYRAFLLPDLIERYSEGLLACLVKDCIAPSDMDRALANFAAARTRPDGHHLWETF